MVGHLPGLCVATCLSGCLSVTLSVCMCLLSIRSEYLRGTVWLFLCLSICQHASLCVCFLKHKTHYLSVSFQSTPLSFHFNWSSAASRSQTIIRDFCKNIGAGTK